MTHNATIECSNPATGIRGQSHKTFYSRNLRIFSNKLECLWGRPRALPANRLERLAKEKILAYYKHLYITAVKSLIVQAPERENGKIVSDRFTKIPFLTFWNEEPQKNCLKIEC